jgi:hypothetical protein
MAIMYIHIWAVIINILRDFKFKRNYFVVLAHSSGALFFFYFFCDLAAEIAKQPPYDSVDVYKLSFSNITTKIVVVYVYKTTQFSMYVKHAVHYYHASLLA